MGSGVPRVGLASQQWGFIMHTHHTMHEAVLAPGLGLFTQVPAIVCDPSTLLGVLLLGLNSKLVNGLLGVPWWVPMKPGTERNGINWGARQFYLFCFFSTKWLLSSLTIVLYHSLCQL